MLYWGSSQSVQAAVTKCRRLGGLSTADASHGSGGWTSETWTQQGCVREGGFLIHSQPFSLCPHIA